MKTRKPLIKSLLFLFSGLVGYVELRKVGRGVGVERVGVVGGGGLVGGLRGGGVR
jgi:hypothetical protein